eukprot:snap_masked-scaffold_4-processed-gene-16.33-mRNA-1 protein AED:1.00 eAED:1.00 QI:0/0/0/0/1/1/2/0/200
MDELLKLVPEERRIRAKKLLYVLSETKNTSNLPIEMKPIIMEYKKLYFPTETQVHLDSNKEKTEVEFQYISKEETWMSKHKFKVSALNNNKAVSSLSFRVKKKELDVECFLSEEKAVTESKLRNKKVGNVSSIMKHIEDEESKWCSRMEDVHIGKLPHIAGILKTSWIEDSSGNEARQVRKEMQEVLRKRSLKSSVLSRH